MRTGLYFGSFNPIHIGHLIIANHIINETDLAEIWFVVSPQNPFKQSATLLNEYDRLHLVRKAVEGNSRFKASDAEFGLPKPSYTAVTLAHLSDKYPSRKFALIMGGDSFQNINRWQNYTAIVQHYPIYVYNRPGFNIKETHGAHVTILNAPLLDISATYIRGLIRDGKSIQYLVPAPIEAELLETRFYKVQKK